MSHSHVDPADPAVGEAWLADRVPAEHLEQLARSGVVSRERRGARRRYRLRYRMAGRQIARNLGSDPALAAAVAAALALRQAPRRAELAANRVVAAANRTLRHAWQAAAPHLRAAGYRLHGRTARRPRVRTTPVAGTQSGANTSCSPR